MGMAQFISLNNVHKRGIKHHFIHFFIMGYLVAMTISVTLFGLVHMFCMIHSIGPINVCTDFDEFRKHAKIVCSIWRHVTQKRYVVRHGG